MPWGTSAMNYAKSGLGAASWAGAAAGTSLLASGSGARLGMSMGAGALYGGTIGRDPGQSRLGGALTGALGGAGMYGAARYGNAFYRGASMSGLGKGMGFGAHAASSMRAGARRAYRTASVDAGRAGQLIGRTRTRAANAFSGMFG